MKDTAFIIFDENGIRDLRKTDRFDLKAGEYATKVRISVPDSYFDRAYPEATLELKERHIARPDVVAEVEGSERALRDFVADRLEHLSMEEREELLSGIDRADTWPGEGDVPPTFEVASAGPARWLYAQHAPIEELKDLATTIEEYAQTRE